MGGKLAAIAQVHPVHFLELRGKQFVVSNDVFVGDMDGNPLECVRIRWTAESHPAKGGLWSSRQQECLQLPLAKAPEWFVDVDAAKPWSLLAAG